MQRRRIIPETFLPEGGRPDPTSEAETVRRIQGELAQLHEVRAGSVLSGIRRHIAMDAIHGEAVPAEDIATDAIIRDARLLLNAHDAELLVTTRFSDGTESIYMTALRDSLSRYAAQKQQEYFEEDYARRPADLWSDVNRVQYGRR